MILDSVHSESHLAIIPALLYEASLCIGQALINDKNTLFFKLALSFFSGFIFNFLTSPFWTKLPFISSAKDQTLPRSNQLEHTKNKDLFFPKKSKSRLHLIFGSISFFLSMIFFEKSKGHSFVANSMTYINIKMFVLVFSGNIKTTTTGKIISSIFFTFSILVSAISTQIHIVYLFLYLFFSWLSNSYIRSLLPIYQNSSRITPPFLLLSGLFSVFSGLCFEQFNFGRHIWKAIFAGFFLFSTPNFYILMKKTLSECKIIIVLTVYPLALLIIFNLIFHIDSQTSLSLYMSTALAYLGGRLLLFSFSDVLVFRPFTSTKSTVYTIFSLYLAAHSILLYYFYIKANFLLNFVSSLYFFINLIWTLSEFFFVAQKTSTFQFSFGYGRLRLLFNFSVIIFTFFTDFCILSQIFQLKNDNLTQHISYYHFIPQFWGHIFIILFFLFAPRESINNRFSYSVRNAVNLKSACPSTDTSNLPKNNFLSVSIDIILFFLSLIDFFFRNVYIDRLVALIYIFLINYIILPIAHTSLSQLLQFAPSFMNISSIRNEIKQCPFVKEIKDINFWQNDDSLNVATIRIRVDEAICPNPQEFLMYVISLCHQVGVLDVTVEIINNNQEIIGYSPPNPYRRSSAFL